VGGYKESNIFGPLPSLRSSFSTLQRLACSLALAFLLFDSDLFLLEAQHRLGRAARILVAVPRKNR